MANVAWFLRSVSMHPLITSQVMELNLEFVLIFVQLILPLAGDL